ncbi:MAG: nucleoside 2-deoxyribosyltransferase [Candidatus Thorarchaeota archaeon]
MVQAYLSAPIIHTTLRKDDFCTVVMKALEDKGITVFAPQFLGPAENRVIYQRDVDNVIKSDFLIAEISNPSLGVGMEIMLSIERLKPILLFYSGDTERLSKMVRGAVGNALFKYDSLEDVDRILRNLNLENLLVLKCTHCDSCVAEVIDDEIHCIACGSTISGGGQ